MKKLTATTILALCIHFLHAQNFTWVKQFGAAGGFGAGATLSLDAESNVYTTGQFMGTVDFDPNTPTYNLSTATSSTYISKLDANGNFIWAKSFVGTDFVSAVSTKIDASGNIYITGDFDRQVDFDPGPAVFTLSAIGDDAFVVKLDNNGNFIWAKQFSGGVITTNLGGNGIAIDNAGNIIISGVFNGTTDFDPGSAVFNMTPSTLVDVFVIKLDANGNFAWGKQITGTGDSEGGYVQLDQAGNIYTTGSFTGTEDFDPGTAAFNLTSPASRNIFVWKLNAAGNFVWAKQVSGNADNYGSDILIDPSGNLYVTGILAGTSDFDTGPGLQNVTALGTTDAYLLKLDAAGNFVWVKQMGGTLPASGRKLSIDPAGNIYLAGELQGTIDADPGPATVTLTCAGQFDLFISKFTPAGNLTWAKRLGGPGKDRAFDLKADAYEYVYSTGGFSQTVDFDPNAGVYDLTTVSGGAFVHKMGPCFFSGSTIDKTACNSYTLNTQTYTSNGIYSQVFTNIIGCDSIVTLHLTINSGSVSNNTASSCGSYTWEGQTLTTSGHYTVTYLNATGCDSILNLDLTVGNITKTISKTICQGENYLGYSTTGTYTDVFSTMNGCDSTRTLNLTVSPTPADFLKATDSICENQQLTIHSLIAYSTYEWSTGSADRDIIVNAPGQYRLEVKDNNGCIGKDTINIYPKECFSNVAIPTAFSPNGDQLNDIFKVTVYQPLLVFRLEVFNRY
ncbi:MAG: SBBP repeat-containing protein, partial [Chitinophagaceae bacterium]